MKLMALNIVDQATMDERASAKKEQERKRIQKEYNLGNDSFSFRDVYNKIPTNARLLVENILGRKSDITEKDFTEDELVEMILLSEMQENNYRNKKNRKFANQPLNQTTVSSYGADPQALGAKQVDESYAASLYRTLTDPQYRVATSLGRFESESNPDDITIKDEYNFNEKQRDLPTDLVGMLGRIVNSPELAGEYLANLFNTSPRQVNIKVPKNYSEGGQVMRDQMEMAFNQQAPQVDPVSGNEVPPGSLPVEVRDDIDAKLSEGEYVVPADVVRFFGVKFFEDLRTKAKMGLAKMDDDGRIGGEPVDMAAMPPQGMDISEEDIAALEQALTTGVYEGGLMDKMAIAAKNDPMVNSRMNAKGMAVGFAEGGLTESLYNDPTRMDSIIEKVMVAANANPALMQELSKRGVAVNTTQANMNPADIKQANTDTVSEELLKEKSTGFAAGGFNPANYGLGFSTFGPTAPGMGGGETTMVSYYNPTTNATMQIAHNANGPITAVPAGFILGSAPVVTNASMGTGGAGSAGRFGGVAIGESYTKPNGETATRMPDSFYASGGDQEQDAYMKGMMDTPADPKSWTGKYDYSDPDLLASTLMDSIDDKETGVQELLMAGPIGDFLGNTIYLDNARKAQTNIEWLKSIATTNAEKDRAKKLQTQLDSYVDDRKIKGDITGDNNKYKTQDIINDVSRTQFGQEQIIKYNKSRMEKSLADKRKIDNPEGTPWYEQTPTDTVSGQASGGDEDQNRAMEALMSRANAERDLATANIASAKGSGSGPLSKKIKDAEDYYVGNKGGLVSRPKKKTKKK